MGPIHLSMSDGDSECGTATPVAERAPFVSKECLIIKIMLITGETILTPKSDFLYTLKATWMFQQHGQISYRHIL